MLVDKLESAQPEDGEQTAPNDNTTLNENKQDETTNETTAAQQESKSTEMKSYVDGVSEEAPEGVEQETYDYYLKLLKKADEIVHTHSREWQFVGQELMLINEKWAEGPAYESEAIAAFVQKLKEIADDFEARKVAHFERLNERKAQNLITKKDLLEQLNTIITEGKWNAQNTVSRLKNKFESIKVVDRTELEKLEKRFAELLETFEKKKVEIMVQRKQKEEDNLTGKLLVLDKLKGLSDTMTAESDWDELENEFNNLNKQWKKIGRVPADKTQETWDKYRELQDQYYDKKLELDAGYKKRIERALAKKKTLIEEAELLMDDADLASAAQKVNLLHRRWKKVDNLPQKDENELWNRFKAATDAFNNLKSDKIDLLRKQENDNLEAKLEIIERASGIATTEDWQKGADQMQQLLDEWKKIGPVPMRKAKTLWDKFKKEMDRYYDARRSHFKEQRSDQKDNLDKKRVILDKLKALKEVEDIDQAMKDAKTLQEEFKNVGFVPIKQKNKVWKEYREVCDEIYDYFREVRKEASKVVVDIDDNVEDAEIKEIKIKRQQLGKLRQEVNKLDEELILKKESLSYFKPTSSSNPLLDQVRKNIEDGENTLEGKKQQMAELKKEIELLAKADEPADQSSEEA